MTKAEARKKAEKELKEDKAGFEMRSCWKCIKTPTLIWCFECGHYYYKGIDVTIMPRKKKNVKNSSNNK
jgi:hypothetical protein